MVHVCNTSSCFDPHVSSYENNCTAHYCTHFCSECNKYLHCKELCYLVPINHTYWCGGSQICLKCYNLSVDERKHICFCQSLDCEEFHYPICPNNKHCKESGCNFKHIRK